MGGCHVPARPYVPASLDHLRVEGHDLRDAQGRAGTRRDAQGRAGTRRDAQGRAGTRRDST